MEHTAARAPRERERGGRSSNTRQRPEAGPVAEGSNRALVALLRRRSDDSERRADDVAARAARERLAPGRNASGPSGHAQIDSSNTAGVARSGGGRPLPDRLTGPATQATGQDLRDVRVHTDGGAAGLTARANAEAVAVGRDVFLRAGRFQPDSAAGRRLLYHELGHVAAGETGRLDSDSTRTERLREILTPWGSPSDAIELMREMSLSESQAVLDSASLQSAAVAVFDNRRMLQAIKALGADLYGSLEWLLDEGNDWEDLREIIGGWSRGHERIRASQHMRDLFVGELGDDEMAAAVDLLGGELSWKLRWMEAEGSSWSLVAGKLDDAPSEQRLALYDDEFLQAFFVDICDNESMAKAADKIGGTLTQKFVWMHPEGADYGTLLSWIRGTPDLAERLALYRSGGATATAIDAVDDDEMRTIVDAIGGSVQEKLSWLLAEGEFDYRPEAGESLPPPDAGPAEVYTKPVLFAADRSRSSDRLYASVTHPGHSREAIVQYLYGTGDVALLPDLPDHVPAGTAIPIPDWDALAPAAHTDLDQVAESGLYLMTEGMTAAGTDAESDLIYRFSAGGVDFQLTPPQLVGMIHTLALRQRRHARRTHGYSRILNETRDEHKANNSAFVRGVSDLAGDVDLPREGFANVAYQHAENSMNAFDAADAATTADEAQRALGRAMSELRHALNEYSIADMHWRYYRQGTIEGAGTAVQVLEITRNVSFGIAAGLAGAVAAPAVFGALAAAKGTAVAAGAAVVAGTATGAGVKGGLEVAATTAQELTRMGINEGDQDFNEELVLERGWHGVKTGALEGGLGALGHFQGAWIASKFGDAFAQTLRGQIAIGAISGGSGELATATVEELLREGEFSGMNVLTRTATGTVLGGATSVIPINGLYRRLPGGGVSYVPLRGAAVTPEWMIASPWRMVQPGGAGQAGASLSPRGTPGYEGAINSLPAERLPELPEGYTWTRVNGNQWGVVRRPGLPDIEIHTWGPPDNPDFYVRHADAEGGPSTPLESRYRTRESGDTYTGNRNHPDELDYRDLEADILYDEGHGTPQAHTKDAPEGSLPSSDDAANFAGEGRDLNRTFLRTLEGRMARNVNPETNIGPGGGTGGGLRKIYVFGNNPRRAASGEALADMVAVVALDGNGRAMAAWEFPNLVTRRTPGNVGDNAVDFNTDVRSYRVEDLATLPTGPITPNTVIMVPFKAGIAQGGFLHTQEEEQESSR